MKVKCWAYFKFADGQVIPLACVREFPAILPIGTQVWFKQPWEEESSEPFGILVGEYSMNEDGTLSCLMKDQDGSHHVEMAGDAKEDVPLLYAAGWVDDY